MIFILINIFLAKANALELWSQNLQCNQDRFKTRLNVLAHEVAVHRPDVLMIQEACLPLFKFWKRSPLTYFTRRLRFHGATEYRRTTLSLGISYPPYVSGMSVFYRVPVSKIRKYRIRSKSVFKRGHIGLKIGGQWLVNVHLPYRIKDKKRRRLHLIEILGRYPQDDTILIGDFNARPEASEFNLLRDLEMTPYFAGKSYPARLPFTEIDGLWAGRNTVVESASLAFTSPLRSPTTGKKYLPPLFISDHLQFRAVIKDKALD